MIILSPHDLDSTRTLWTGIAKSPALLLYVGPDQLMPLTSIFGAIVGVALMFWSKIVMVAGKLRRLISRPKPPSVGVSPEGPLDGVAGAAQSKPLD